MEENQNLNLIVNTIRVNQKITQKKMITRLKNLKRVEKKVKSIQILLQKLRLYLSQEPKNLTLKMKRLKINEKQEKK